MIATASSLAKKAKNLAVDTSRTCINGGSWEDKYSCCIPTTTVGRVCAKM